MVNWVVHVCPIYSDNIVSFTKSPQARCSKKPVHVANQAGTCIAQVWLKDLGLTVLQQLCFCFGLTAAECSAGGFQI